MPKLSGHLRLVLLHFLARTLGGRQDHGVVVGERRQIDYRFDNNAKWIEEDIEVRVRNQKDEAVTVIVKENLYRWTNWSIIKKNQAFDKIDSRTVHFPLKISGGGEGVVRYTVRYTW